MLLYCGCLRSEDQKDKGRGWASTASVMSYFIEEHYDQCYYCDIWIVGMEVLLQMSILLLVGRARFSPCSGFLSDAEPHVEPAQPSDSGHIACDKLAFRGLIVHFLSPVLPAYPLHLPCPFLNQLIYNVTMPGRYHIGRHAPFLVANETGPGLQPPSPPAPERSVFRTQPIPQILTGSSLCHRSLLALSFELQN